MVLYILIFKFLDRKMEDKKFCTEWYHTLLCSVKNGTDDHEFFFAKQLFGVVSRAIRQRILSKTKLKNRC